MIDKKQLDADILALMTAGCEMEYKFNNDTNMMTIKTKHPCSVVRDEDGRIIEIYEYRTDKAERSQYGTYTSRTR